MAFRVFGSAEVLSVHAARDFSAVTDDPQFRRATEVVRKQAHRAVFSYVPREGFLYVRSRAISSRCNDNYDYFGPEEIEKSYRTFIGKPVFVNHYNSDHRQARGVVIDAALHKDRNPDGSPDTWCEALMEVDGLSYPKLALALLKGDIDRTSMGCDVQISKCSVCGNEAKNPLEYCRHIPGMKGKTIYALASDGMTRVGKLVYEECFGLSFFENSLLVEPPADPTAYFLGQVDMGPGLEHLAKAARLADAVAEAGAWKVTAAKKEPKVVPAPRSPQRPPEPRDPLPQPDIVTPPKKASALDSVTAARRALTAAFHEADLQVTARPKKRVSEMDEEEKAAHAADRAKGQQWIADHPPQAKHVVASYYRSTDAERSAGTSWYPDAHRTAHDLAEHTGVTPDQAVDLIALYSPGAHWSNNLHAAVHVARTRKAVGGPGVLSGGFNATGAQARQAQAVIDEHKQAHEVLGPTAHKVRAFAHLIRYGGNADDKNPQVCVDRHAASVACGERVPDHAEDALPLGSKRGYGAFSKVYVDAAKTISRREGHKVHPHEVQATTWLTQQRENETSDKQTLAKSRPASNAHRATSKLLDYVGEHFPSWHMTMPGTGYTPRARQEALFSMDELSGEPHTASLRRLAYNETKAPTDVDTLRDEQCAICGNTAAFDGRECRVCGYIAPPKGLDDPDVEKAQQLDDLKQSVDDEMDASGADPSRPGADFDAGDLDQVDEGGDDTNNPWLTCTNCETQMRPAAPQTSGPSTTPGNSSGGPAEGDVCPVCQKGELASTDTSEDETDDAEQTAQDEEQEQPPDAKGKDTDEVPGQDDGDAEDDEDEGDDDPDPDDPKSRKKKPGANPASTATAAMKYREHSKEFGMSNNALQALASQQNAVETLQLLVDHQQRTIHAQQQKLASQRSQISRLTAGLSVIARALGVGVETQVRQAMLQKRADEQNPAQPVPEPVGGPPTQTTPDAETPEAFADVRTPGMVAGVNNDVPADAVTTVYTPGQDIAAPPFNQLVDVTQPVAGTQGPRPLSEVKTLTDVRVGNPMNPQTAFPLGGPFAQAQRTGSAQQGEAPPQNEVRTMASIRLARLRIASGIEQGDDLTVGQRIASDSGMSMDRINQEINTLNDVRKAASRSQQAPPRGAVPRSASAPVQRIVPPLSATASMGGGRGQDDLSDVEAIFVG